MGNLAKTISKLLADPPEARFEDVERVLEAYGYQRHPSKHDVFRNPDAPPHRKRICIPTVGGRKVKRHYVREVVAFLGLEEGNEQ